MTTTKPKRPDLATVNRALHTFAPWLTLQYENRRLVIHRSAYHGLEPATYPIRQNHYGSGVDSHGGLCIGGTGERAISHLIHWLRGNPHQPLGWWRRVWPQAVPILETTNYNDPYWVGCILCGQVWDKDGFDWWTSPTGKRGPVCYGRCCQKDNS